MAVLDCCVYCFVCATCRRYFSVGLSFGDGSGGFSTRDPRLTGVFRCATLTGSKLSSGDSTAPNLV